MLESKIDATHRLQKDGRWEEASEYRTEQRLKFREQGLTKKESNEKAWEAMILEYPAPDEDRFVFFLAASEFPPVCIDSETTSFFRVYCRVRALLHFICPTEMSLLKGPVAERRLEPQVELPPTSFDAVERTNDLLEFAFEHPVDFLGHASEVLEEAVDQIPDDALAAEESRLELKAYVGSIPTLQRIVQQQFAGALGA